jgi:hypothetical protein
VSTPGTRTGRDAAVEIETSIVRKTTANLRDEPATVPVRGGSFKRVKDEKVK